MLSRMLGPLSVICLGAVSLYIFFAALGAISPGEVIWPTIVVGALAVLAVIRSLYVRHELGEHGNQAMRSANSLRERRGF